jgi:GMP reductase
MKPRKTIVGSRKECDTSVQLGNYKFKMPVIPANMMSVINEESAMHYAKNGYMYVMHRFGIDENSFIGRMNDKGYIASISIGVNEDSYEKLKSLMIKPQYITLDIAHAWCPKAEKMIKFIKDSLPDTFLIAGNVATAEAVIDLENWGADCVKLFVGPGKVCTTKLATGFTRGTVNCILECVEVAKKPIIADGGIREAGDIAKAICLGADMVMAGSIFSGFEISPGDTITLQDGKKYKEYFGSSTQFSKGKHEHIEGKKILIDYKGEIDYFLRYLEESLKSSISYAGGGDLSSLRRCEYFILEN